MEEDTQIKKRKYDGINVKPNTKLRVDKLYYKLKLEKGYKSFDDFINEVFDAFENKNK